MKRPARPVCLFASLLAFTLPLTAQENPLNGSWKMDKSSLKYTGPMVTITTDPDGYTVMRGDKVPHKVVCDGKPNPPDAGVVTECTKTGTGYSLLNTRGGKPSSKINVEVSADGKKMTRTVALTPSDDSPFTMTFVSKRISGSAGSRAVWQEVSFDESQETGLLTIMVKGDSVDVKESDADKAVTCKLGGPPVSLPGKRTVSAKMLGAHTLKLTYTSDGKLWRMNTFALGPDGKTVKETDLTPAPDTSSMSVLFHKA